MHQGIKLIVYFVVSRADEELQVFFGNFDIYIYIYIYIYNLKHLGPLETRACVKKSQKIR